VCQRGPPASQSPGRRHGKLDARRSGPSTTVQWGKRGLYPAGHCRSAPRRRHGAVRSVPYVEAVPGPGHESDRPRVESARPGTGHRTAPVAGRSRHCVRTIPDAPILIPGPQQPIPQSEMRVRQTAGRSTVPGRRGKRAAQNRITGGGLAVVRNTGRRMALNQAARVDPSPPRSGAETPVSWPCCVTNAPLALPSLSTAGRRPDSATAVVRIDRHANRRHRPT